MHFFKFIILVSLFDHVIIAAIDQYELISGSLTENILFYEIRKYKEMRKYK